MYGSTTYGGAAYANIDERRPAMATSGAGGVSFPESGETQGPASTIQSSPGTRPVAGGISSGGSFPYSQTPLVRSTLPSVKGRGGGVSSRSVTTLGSPFASVEPMLGAARLTPQEFSNQWLFSYRYAQDFVLRLTEKAVNTVWPSVPVADSNVLFKNQIEITGTEDSPQTLQTTVGVLEIMQNGASWPLLDTTLYSYQLEINGGKYQSANISKVLGSESVTLGVLEFQIYHDFNGNPATDGKYYADIVVKLLLNP